MKPYIVYILECADGTLYTGITTDLERRLAGHRRGTASKYTRSRLPVKLVYAESAESRSHALKREHEIKRMKREEKRKLIETQGGAAHADSKEL